MTDPMLKDLAEVMRRFDKQLLMPWEAIEFLRTRHAAIEQNARDAERLTWLAVNGTAARSVKNGSQNCVVWYSINGQTPDDPLERIRRDLDAAMSQETGRE